MFKLLKRLRDYFRPRQQETIASAGPVADLLQRLKKTDESLGLDNLAALALKYEGEVALLVIDVQKVYCDPKTHIDGEEPRGTEETKAIAERIQSIVPEFRKAGVPVYDVYFSRDRTKKPDQIGVYNFYQFTPAAGDTLVAKNEDSAFEGSNIKNTLEKDHKKLLLICGFNQAACVEKTAIDARLFSFKVCLLEDLSGNDYDDVPCKDEAAAKMLEAGIVMTTSGEALKQLRHAPR